LSDSSPLISQLVDAFRRGDADAGSELLKHYRPWLNLLARLQIDAGLQGKFDASDVVQQTMLEAVRDFPQFRGATEPELKVWLRQILAHALGHEIHRYRGTLKRELSREVSIDQRLAESSRHLQDLLAAPGSSPSEQAIRGEQEVLLANVLERLPADYREVIMLRNLQGLSHDDVARRMDRKPGATRMLWVRALACLKKEVEAAGG
jgi:RNA polymerase sigma-70 factor (ECF subfamily)